MEVSEKNNSKIYELLNKHIVAPVTNKINEHSKCLKDNSDKIKSLRLWRIILILIIAINLLFSSYLFIYGTKINNDLIKINDKLEKVFTQLENNSENNEKSIDKQETLTKENTKNNTVIEQNNNSNTDTGNTLIEAPNSKEQITDHNNNNQNNNFENYENNIQYNNMKNDKYETQENYDDDNPPVIENIDRKKSNDTNGDSRIDDLHNKNEQLLKELNNE